jgi:5'(3')-deoxyribonucleotidase
MKQVVYVDMDGVLVDLKSEINRFGEMMPGLINRLGSDLDKIPNLFKDPRPISGAVAAFKALCQKYEVYILSTAPWDNPDAWTHKRLWVEKHLGKDAYKRLILSHHKNLCQGDYLIDDRTANGAGEFSGELIQFGSAEFPTWEEVLNHLKV